MPRRSIVQRCQMISTSLAARWLGAVDDCCTWCVDCRCNGDDFPVPHMDIALHELAERRVHCQDLGTTDHEMLSRGQRTASRNAGGLGGDFGKLATTEYSKRHSSRQEAATATRCPVLTPIPS